MHSLSHESPRGHTTPTSFLFLLRYTQTNIYAHIQKHIHTKQTHTYITCTHTHISLHKTGIYIQNMHIHTYTMVVKMYINTHTQRCTKLKQADKHTHT